MKLKSYLLSITLLMCTVSGIALAQTGPVQDLETQLANANEDSVKLRLHFEVASSFYSMTPQEVLLHVDTMLYLAEKLNLPIFTYRAMYLQAVAHYLSGDLDIAERVINQVDSSAFFEEDLKSLMDVYNLMGTILSSRGKVSEALNYQYRALEIARTMQDPDRQVTALTNIAQTYTENLDTSKSLDYYLEALEMAESISDTVSIAVINNNLSGITQDPDQKLAYAGRAIALFQSLNYADGIAHSSNEFAIGLRKKRAYKEALKYLYRSIGIWKNNQYKQGLVSAYTNIGVVFGYLNQLDSVARYFDLATSLGDDLEDKSIAKEAYEEMSEMYEVIGQPALALMNLKRAAQLKDLLYSQERAQQLALAETDFETREKEQRLAEQQLTISRQKDTQKNVIIGGSLAILLVLGLLLYIRYRNQIRRKDSELKLELEKAEAEKLRELDRLKTNFFTNISHEFRTPLTLIQTPLNAALQDSKNDQSVVLPKSHAHSMSQSAAKLLQLVNRLLDLAKLEAGKMQLFIRMGDMAQFIRSIGYGFESLALNKQINYHVIVPSAPVLVWYDREKIEQIISNLLANAFKFTPSGGRISLEAKFADDAVKIFVRDNGQGIEEEELPQIFDRFFSNSQWNHSDSSSSGIGLALTRELVHLHQGLIAVESDKVVGTTFSVTIPTNREAYNQQQVDETDVSTRENMSRHMLKDLPAAGTQFASDLTTHNGKPHVLVVEDNKDLREYIAGELSPIFQVKTAINGLDGLQKAIEFMPDLIITDVMMPEMDGTELCQKLREKVETCHIPIIMLTAKADRSGKLSGLDAGADDYLTKPFDHEELVVRANNLITQRALLKRKFAQGVLFKPSEIATNSVDEDFLAKVLQTIEENMEETSFGVEDLGHAVALSRSQLHRKLKAITDRSPNELIRNLRLERARELLEKKSGTASEVAYRVGFSSLSYFSKCFKDQYGLTPSEVESDNGV
ncbi:MAG: response regulator [Saprospiraceae bacterium]|nr:response regulator [Saprospiraceae bacterium]